MSSNLRIEKNVIMVGDERVGTIGSDGTYQLVDVNGTVQTGSVAGLIQEGVRNQLSVAGQGVTGKLRLGAQTLEVVGGTVFHEGTRVGSIDGRGAFGVTVRGTPMQGNAFTTPGAVWLGGTAGSGPVTIDDLRFTAIDGVIYENGSAIGWLDGLGLFRAVRANGDYFEGTVGAPTKALYLRAVAP